MNRPAPSAPPLAPTPTGVFAPSAQQLAGASAALAFVVGPIARILVPKAAAQTASAEAFVDHLCTHANGAEAVELRRKLSALF